MYIYSKFRTVYVKCMSLVTCLDLEYDRLQGLCVGFQILGAVCAIMTVLLSVTQSLRLAFYSVNISL